MIRDDSKTTRPRKKKRWMEEKKEWQWAMEHDAHDLPWAMGAMC